MYGREIIILDKLSLHKTIPVTHNAHYNTTFYQFIEKRRAHTRLVSTVFYSSYNTRIVDGTSIKCFIILCTKLRLFATYT